MIRIKNPNFQPARTRNVREQLISDAVRLFPAAHVTGDDIRALLPDHLKGVDDDTIEQSVKSLGLDFGKV